MGPVVESVILYPDECDGECIGSDTHTRDTGMKRTFSRYLLPGLLIFTIGGFLGMRLDANSEKGDPLEQLRKVEDTFMLIDRQYVEEVDEEKLAESAIEAMLKQLDPHSVYIDAENVRKVQDEYKGSFGGIGIWFEVPVDDTARVTSTFPDGPGEGVGVMAGDRMIAVDGKNIIGVGSLEIQNMIKGPKNTPVTLTVSRPGVRNPIDFRIIRQIIPLYSVDAGYMLDGETGYIRIGRFAMTTPDEFRTKVNELKKEGLKRLIIDLRGNPGGVKDAAVDVADEMLDGRGVIVTTRGRNPRENEVDPVTPGGVLSSEPVIVLVDESSASGSEIVAGALQDHDRALIVGRRTFGKGLVQRPFQLDDGSIVQMTVARYYMPSGRLIQTPYENGELEDYYKQKFSNYEEAVLHPETYLSDLPDSLKYQTDHGRTVFGGGGVMPDVVIPPDSTLPLNSLIVQSMLRNGTPFLFVRETIDTDHSLRDEWKDRRDDFVNSFHVDGAFWDAFVRYAEANHFSFNATQADPSEGAFTAAELSAARPTLETILKARIAQRLFRGDAWYPVFNSIDPVLQASLKLWSNAETLSAYHGAGGAGPQVQGG